jgi:hypothetical protein
MPETNCVWFSVFRGTAHRSEDFALPFTPFAFVGADTMITGEGKLEFEFTEPGNAAFFRLQAQ